MRAIDLEKLAKDLTVTLNAQTYSEVGPFREVAPGLIEMVLRHVVYECADAARQSVLEQQELGAVSGEAVRNAVLKAAEIK